jgi:hypothetical protein
MSIHKTREHHDGYVNLTSNLQRLKQVAILAYVYGWIYNQNVNCLLHLTNKILENCFQITSIV